MPRTPAISVTVTAHTDPAEGREDMSRGLIGTIIGILVIIILVIVILNLT